MAETGGQKVDLAVDKGPTIPVKCGCGGKAKVRKIIYQNSTSHAVICLRCKTRTKLVYSFDGTLGHVSDFDLKADHKEVVEIWNKCMKKKK